MTEPGDAGNGMAVALAAREGEHAQRELDDAEDCYRLLFAQNPHPMWIYDAVTLAFLEVNDAAVEHYGYSRREFLTMHITDIRPVEALSRLIAPVDSVREPLMRSGNSWHRLKSGEIIDAEITSHTLTFSGRAAVVVTTQDITVRTRAEAALAERVALTTVSAEVGAALNRTGELRAGMRSCAEAIVTHLDLAAEVQIWLKHPVSGAFERTAAAGQPPGNEAQDRPKAGEWPLTVGERPASTSRISRRSGSAATDRGSTSR